MHVQYIDLGLLNAGLQFQLRRLDIVCHLIRSGDLAI